MTENQQQHDYFTLTEDGIEVISEQELIQQFHDATNDEYGTVKVLGNEFGVADVLKEMDPIAYRDQFFAWLDMEVREGAVFISWDGEQ